MPNDLDIAKLLDGVSDGSNFQTEINIITLSDNLSHPYFEDIRINKDNINPIGNVVLTTLYTNDVLKYWASYSGIVVVSIRMLDSNKDNTNSNNFFEKSIKPKFAKYQETLRLKNERSGLSYSPNESVINQVLQNDYYNYSFIGKVSRFKQKGKRYVLYLEDLGWKFMQKVPKAFRDSYIAGQYLDDAFQAICEFMDVEFAYSIEELHKYTFSTDGYSIQKDGQTIEDVPQILREWATGTEEGEDIEEENVFDSMDENTGLIEFNQKNNIVNNDKKESNKNLLDVITDVLTGNGEDSKDDEAMLQEKIDKYQEEFDEKIMNLFIGNTFYGSDLCSPLLDYSKITIEPKSITENTNITDDVENNKTDEEEASDTNE